MCFRPVTFHRARTCCTTGAKHARWIASGPMGAPSSLNEVAEMREPSCLASQRSVIEQTVADSVFTAFRSYALFAPCESWRRLGQLGFAPVGKSACAISSGYW